MDHKTYSGQLFLEGYSCSQAVLAAFSDVTGLSKEFSARLASPFGGGMGRMREVCGAVSGMLMVAGLLYGYESPDDSEGKRALYRDVQAMAAKFRETAGSIICRELLKNPPSDPNPTPRTSEFYNMRPCGRMVMLAAEILDQFIAEHPL